MAFWDYTGLVGKVAGTIIGAYFGGPMGAMVGGTAGEMEGGKIGAIGKGEGSITDLLTPGPVQQAQQQPMQLDPLNRGMDLQMANNFKMPTREEGWDPTLIDVPSGAAGESASGPIGGQPQQGGFDFTKLLMNAGHMLSGVGAGVQGDTDYFNRLTNQREVLRQRDREQNLREDKASLDRLDSMSKAVTNMELLQRYAKEEDKPQLAQELSAQYQKAGLTMFTPEMVADVLSGESTALTEFKSTYGFLEKSLTKPQLAQLGRDFEKDPAKTSQRVAKMVSSIAQDYIDKGEPVPGDVDRAITGENRRIYKEQAGDAVFTQMQNKINTNGLNKDITLAEFLKMPNANLLSDEHLSRINAQGYKDIKPARRIESEAQQQASQAFQIEQQARSQQFQSQENAKQQAAIEERAQRREANMGVALIQARREAEQNAPLDTKATRWVNPTTLEFASPDMTPVEARNAGYAVVSSNLSQAVPSARAALKTLDRYKELSDKLLVKPTGDSVKDATAIQANRLRLKAAELAGNEDVREFKALGSTIVQHVKAFGDTGNVAYKEAEFQLTALPDFTDTQASAERKIQSRKKLLTNVVRNSLSASQKKVEETAKKASELSDAELLRQLNK